MIHEVERLFALQVKSWPLLAAGFQNLSSAQTRAVRVDSFDIFLRHTPHRLTSTTASVDPASVAKRPCFLCPKNLPPEQESIAFDNQFSVYCNPFPIVDRHLTIVHRDHRPQRIGGHFGNMLELAKALPGYFVIYNGAECGASAPDHLHFQAGLRTLFPIEKDTAASSKTYERYALIFRDGDQSRLIGRLERSIDMLSSVTHKTPEPLINIAAFHEEPGGWTVYLFPRAKHRPDVFHRGELIVSPGAIDLCGIFVVAREQDFVRMSGEDVASILREVTLPADQCREVVEKVERAQ